MKGKSLSIENEIEMLDNSVIYTFLHVWSILWVWLGRGKRYPNFLLTQTVRNFPLAKGVQIIEVGLYSILLFSDIEPIVLNLEHIVCSIKLRSV